MPPTSLRPVLPQALGAAIPSTAFLAGVRLTGASRGAVLMTLEPVIAVLLAALFLAEAIVPLQVAGGAAVLAGGTILQLERAGE